MKTTKHFPCKSCIKVTNGGCCNQLPVLSQEEYARLIFKYSDIIDEKKLQTKTYKNDIGMIVITPPLTPEEDKKGISLDDYQCPFLDIEKGCLIYEDRPLLCKRYGETIGACPYEGMDEVKEEDKDEITYVQNSFSYHSLMELKQHYKSRPVKELPTKKAMKMINQKEFKHLLIACSELVDVLRKTDLFNTEYKYGVIYTNDQRVSPYEMIFIKEKYPYSALQKPYNFVQRKLAMINNDLLMVLQEKINKVLKGIHFPEKANGEVYKVLFSVLYLEYFKDNYKRKLEDYKSLITSDELYALKKALVVKLGYSGLIAASSDETISEMNRAMESLYKQINQLK